ncbi:LCP family protein [Limosilactobacillus caecicola]|uniref:LCP family protein n=1 Tax=Limosilactobacillus caecicola TaxID=2941332 RepID=UPI00203BD13B|nr:LCP family protein [Limosilactobacillus caecicola]
MNDEHETRAEYRHELEERIHHNVDGDFDHRPPYIHRHHGSHKWVWTIICLVGLILLIGGGYEYHQLHSTAKGVFSSGDGKIDKKLAEGKPVSVLAMGTDVGALNRGNTGGNTDTLEVITVNPKKQTITMTSIPRDTLVRVNTSDGADYVKINAAYSIGGAKQTVKQVKELLGIPIDYYAVVNMGVLKKVVNAVGGVDVNNPFAFTYEGHHFPKGKQHLNGNLALKYSRMRYEDPNNDYGRQKRQQQVMKSVISKFKKSGSVSAVNKILKAVKDGVKTNIPLDSISVLYGNYRSAMNNVKTYHFKGQDATIDGTSFQIASPKEINRVSKLIRKQLGLKPKTVTNYETKMYKAQKNYDGYTNTTFVLPGNAEYNVAGSGSSSKRSSSTTTGSLSSSVSSRSSYSNSYGYGSSESSYGYSY